MAASETDGLTRPGRWWLMLPFALALAVCLGAVQWAGERLLARLDSGGFLRGIESDGVIRFLGVPFAAPPIGPLRWRAPRPAVPWTGIRQTTEFGPSCIQPDLTGVSEDCLSLNIWRPATIGRPLPVMVWLYGGALVHGSSRFYPGEALASRGVIVVTLNYRVGRLGFFAHPALMAEAPDEVHGNFGYLDQLAALHWVKRNIAAFGGDPQSVTLFGESAGAGAVLLHMISPLSRGLFHRGILQSPAVPSPRTSVTPLADREAAERSSADFAGALGITSRGQEALTALRALPLTKFIEGLSTPEVFAALSAGKPLAGMPIGMIDGRFVIEMPQAALAAARQAKMPLIIGTTERDLALGDAAGKDDLFALFGTDADAARRVYDPAGDRPLAELKQQVLADRTMNEPARHLANAVSGVGQPVWLYRFSYVPEFERGTVPGALHGYEIPFVFGLPEMIAGNKTSAADKSMADTAAGYWTDFAKTGDPNGGSRPVWQRYDADAATLADFTNDGVVVGPDRLKPRLDLWQRHWHSSP